MKSKSWYRINNSNGETSIDIMQEIGGWGISAEQFRNDVKSLDEGKPIRVHINSDGGDIFTGNEIYNLLMEHKGKVTVEIGALAASMASVIAMAGDEITIAENGMLMIHRPWSLLAGDSEEFRKAADVMDDLERGIIRAYQRQTNLSTKDISGLLADETWLTAEEARQLGFVDSIIEVADTADTNRAMNFNVSRFQNSAQFVKQLRKNSMQTKEKLIKGNAADGGDPEDDDVKVKAGELFAAERKRIGEIQDIVAEVKKRDKLDFSNEARKAIQEGVSVDAFSKALVTSDRFKNYTPIGDGGGGFEIVGERRGNTLGELVTQTNAFRALAKRGSLPKGQSVTIDVPRSILSFRPRAATPVTSTGVTSIEKLPGVPGFLPLQSPKVADLIAQYPVVAPTVRYIKESSFSNTVATVGEGAAKPEQLFSYAEVEAPVKKLAAWTKFSDEIMQDFDRIVGHINGKLINATLFKLDDQIVNGTGLTTNMTGILATSGIQTQAQGADTALDALLKAITKIRVAFWEPDAIVLNPTDWQTLRLKKDATNNQYYGGGPFTGAYGNPDFISMPSVWGLPVVVTAVIASGTALVGAFKSGAELYMRTGLQLDIVNTDQDDFIKNLLTMRVEMRAALGVTHPLAFCTVTSLA